MADKLSSKKHDHILKNRIIPAVLGAAQPASGQPTMALLGGQPGAGKGGVRNQLKQVMASAVEIDIDELRIYHPDYLAFVKENSATAASRVQEDCSEWAGEVFAEAIKRRLNVIYDGTLSVSSKATSMAKSASKAGYGVEVHVVATSSDVSEQGVMGRFEEANEAWTADPTTNAQPRSVPARIQKAAYDNIPDTLEDLCKSGVVSRMRIADRSGTPACDLKGKAAVRRDGPKQAPQALKEQRNRPWTADEIAEYETRAKKIVKLMEGRNAPKKERDKVEAAQGDVVATRKQELKADQKLKDDWVRSFAKFDVSTLDNLQQPPVKENKVIRLPSDEASDDKSGMVVSGVTI